ncbi:hypothetical protein J3R83DRAFT_13225 [Lanmaoa asiatica]|nr:hypothetical protein J3R83DRAFT_13225 [Lanmaoa asiatica]
MLLKQETHEARLRLGEKEMEGKGTAKSYPRQVHNYQTWFDAAQAHVVKKDPTRVVIPAFPITATKAAMFLQHESTHEKYQRGSRSNIIEGSSLGKSHIAQVISALEKHRLNHEHEHPCNHETRMPL